MDSSTNTTNNVSIKLEHEHLTRQIDLIPVATLGLPIKIIGAGAIGSFVALQLAKMGFEDITVWDHDTVDTVNMNCQFYRFKDIGKPKVIALQQLIEDFTNVKIKACHGKWQPYTEDGGVFIVAVDSMETRKEIFAAIKDNCFNAKYIIDPRMGAEDALMYTINPFSEKDCTTYEKVLYSDKDSVQERCTAKSTIYTANLLSGLVSKAVKNLACKEPYPRVSMWSIGKNQLQSWEGEHEH